MFQNEYRELANKFKENEKIIQKLAMSGATFDEVNDELDNLETVTKALSVDVLKAKKLAKTGSVLMLEHSFSRRSLEPSVIELRNMCKKQKIMFLEKRGSLLKFLDLYNGIVELNDWCHSVSMYLQSNETAEEDLNPHEQLKQLNSLQKEQREMVIRSRTQFEEYFYDIKDLIQVDILLSVDETLTKFEEIKKEFVMKRNSLREKIGDDPNISMNIDDKGCRETR